MILGPIVLDGYGHDLQVLTASITTIHEGVPHDGACVLAAGEHPFIKHASYIYYRRVHIDSLTHTQQMVDQGVWKPNDPCADALIEKIRAGLCESRLVRREIKVLYGCSNA